MNELEPPLPGRVLRFDELDQVGRLVLEDGEVLRFGATACQGVRPRPGDEFFVTAVAPHPLGGRRAAVLRKDGLSERERRERERADSLRPRMTPKYVRSRVLELASFEGEGEMFEASYRLVDELKLVGPTSLHAKAILAGIAAARPLAFLGNPGPLVHFVERHSRAQDLFAVAAEAPTTTFVVVLMRIGDPFACAILERYAEHESLPAELRDELAEYLENPDD